MPILTASGKMSSHTASSCCFKNSGVDSWTAMTPVVFSAASAVTALMAYTPFMVIVFRSACMPASPMQSLPAIVNAVFIFMFLFSLPCPPFSQIQRSSCFLSESSSKKTGDTVRMPPVKKSIS